MSRQPAARRTRARVSVFIAAFGSMAVLTGLQPATGAASPALDAGRGAADVALRALTQPAAPVITSVSPNGGLPTAGGTTIRILGEHFALSGDIVTLGGARATLASATETELIVTSPAGSGADQPLVVSVEGEASNSFLISYAPPSIAALSPVEGEAAKSVVIYGSNFAASASQDHVLFGSAEAEILSDTHTRIEVKPPAGTGSVQVKVITSGQVSNGETFTYIPLCQPGQYSSTGYAPCKPTPAGTFVAAEGAVAGTPCPGGTFSSEPGATQCTEAPPGNFVPVPQGGQGAIQATPCATGTYSPGPGAVACIEAPPGTYVEATGQASYTQCPAGTYNPERGSITAASCLTTPAGSYDPAGSPAATKCAAGYYQPQTGQGECLAAEPGHDVASSGALAQSLCAAGTYSALSAAAACPNAPAGSYDPTTGETSPVMCAAGSYQPEAGQPSCLTTPAGSYDPAGSPDAIECATGHYQPLAGEGECLTAEPGHFVGVTGAETESTCPTGTYGPQAGEADCQSAPAGYYDPATGETIADACPTGSYQPQTGQTSCLTADVGYYVATAGSPSESRCPTEETTAGSGSASPSDCVRYTLSSGSLPEAHPLQAYSFQLTIRGGDGGPYKLKLKTKLPKGLKLAKTGLISGTVSKKAAAGSYTIEIEVKDASKKAEVLTTVVVVS